MITEDNGKITLQAVKDDFKLFLFLVWMHLGLPAPTPVQYAIADYLQYGPKRQIIEAFRGVGKSWITAAFVLWCLLRDPQERLLVVSASKERADRFTSFVRSLINEMPILQHLKPRRGQLDTRVAFDVAPSKPSQAPSVKSAGIGGQITGSRATRIIADDIEVPNNSMTADMREKLVHRVLEFEAIIVPEIGRITYLGTPQTEESVYNELRERGYAARIWPARYPEDPSVYGGALADDMINMAMIGRATDPQRFDDNDLEERELSYGKAGFSLQFMLDTSLSDAERYPLKHGDLVVMDTDNTEGPASVHYGSSPAQQLKDLSIIGFSGDRWYMPLWIDSERVEYQGVFMGIDPSGRGTDETAYMVVAQLNSKLFLLDGGGLKGGYDEETMTTLASIAKKYKVNKIVIESNFGDGMFTQLFRPYVIKTGHAAELEEVRHNTQKEVRIIDTLEPVMMQHRLIVSKAVVERDIETMKDDMWSSLFYQMTRITKDRGALKHDDRLDCLAMTVRAWVDTMDQDEEESNKARREEDYMRGLLEEFDGLMADFSLGGV